MRTSASISRASSNPTNLRKKATSKIRLQAAATARCTAKGTAETFRSSLTDDANTRLIVSRSIAAGL